MDTQQQGNDPIPYYEAPQEFDPAVPIDSIEEWGEENPNEGNEEVLLESLDKHGFFGGVLIQKSSRRIIAGNTRYRTATSKGAKTIPAFLVDWDDEQAKSVLLMDNQSARLAVFNEEKLIALLKEKAESPGGLRGTGFTEDNLADLIQAWNPPDLETVAGPETQGGGDDLWPVLRFKVSPETRDRFYELTDGADDKTDEGRFLAMLDAMDPEP